ncbi:GNAT family N-acetyltransferase [Pseudolabrys sp. FHR47]|uniref:GNAT family N-acetyltransferase n=1 Tax=Pseudolabrys sp. FHR47 TaxID=2562284 RepID=UPI0010BF4DC4|nr:GNAT family N-acetyltransferase [Pseudolabrys sp. FHR47]
MIDRAFLARIRIEPLDRKKHDRAAFSCGEERLDNFLKSMAARQQDDDHTRVYVACLDAGPGIAGFYALNSHAIDATTLPPDQRRKLPSYPTIPAIYLSVVAVARDQQGNGLGKLLLADAFKRCVVVADQIGAHFIVLDALNERAAKLYRELGFVDLPGHEPRMLIKMEVVRRAIKT